MQWETVIGLEVHVQLNTKSKIFSGAANQYGAEPNTQACAIDLGLPGVLPVLNQAALEKALKFGLAINAEISDKSVFARKNYFYPDLPKGYQISQHMYPVVGKGFLEVNLGEGKTKRINITRAHLEEDAGKSLHDVIDGMSGIDLNRAGTPLLEIVSEPEMRSAEEAVAYLKTLHSLVRYLDISDGNMQEGSFRCDANVSVRLKGQNEFGTRVEIKNINSFRFVQRAIEYEVERQIEVLSENGQIRQETRLYDPDKDETRSLRSKEDANDYRYFPDPDLLPVLVDAKLLNEIRKTLPELPWEKKQRYISSLNLSEYDADVLVQQLEIAHYYEAVIQHLKPDQAKMAANWVIGELLGALNKNNDTIANCPIESAQLAKLISRIHDQTISGKIAKQIFEILWQEKGDVDQIIEQKGLKQITDDSALVKAIAEVIQQNPEQIAEYRAGKERVFGFLVGQVMKATKGKANPQQVNELLKKHLADFITQ